MSTPVDENRDPAFDAPAVVIDGTSVPHDGRTGVHRILAVLTQLGAMNAAVGLGGVVRNKIMAIYLKPSGFGEFTQIAAIATSIYVLVQFGMSVGLSRHAAAIREPKKRQEQLSVANSLTAGLALVSLVFLLPPLFTSGADPLLRTLGVVPTFEHKLLLGILLAVAPVEALRNNYLCFLQGILDIEGMSMKRSVAILVSTVAAVPLIAIFRMAGAAAQMVLGTVFLAVLLGRRCRKMGFHPLAFAWQKRTALTLAGWGGASLISNLALNSTETLIRGHLIATSGLAANGLYQSASLVSGQIMAVILGSIGAYSLATLAESNDTGVAKLRMTELLRLILPITTLSLGVLGLFSIPLLALLFTRSFIHAATFFPLQLGAHYLQAAAWIVGAPLLGFGFVRTWTLIQLAGSVLRLVVTFALSSWVGLYAVPGGLLVAVAFDLAADIVFCWFFLCIRFDPILGRTFLLGGLAILICAMIGISSHSLITLCGAALLLCAYVAAMAWRETQESWKAILSFCKRTVL